MASCVFCDIATGKIPSQKVAETDGLFAFRDIKPAAPVHVLIVPKKHVATLNDFSEADAALAGKMLLFARQIARSEKIDASGYRTIVNVNADGGQVVFHVHMHVLGGRSMRGLG